jgi:four helix bundle protein
MQDFKRLKVWQKAHQFTIELYKMTMHLPKDELYGITSQIRRASVSIPTNIAEGCGRDGSTELKRFLSISLGSTVEVEYLLLLTKDLQFIDEEQYQQLNAQVDEIRKMLIAFVNKINDGIFANP